MNIFRRLLNSSDAKPSDISNSSVEIKQPASKGSSQTPPVPAAEATSPITTHNDVYLGDGATRPLNEETLLNYITPKHVSFGQGTDIGSVRTNNQDAAFSFYATTRSATETPDFGLFVLADGMGGHIDGEKASAIAIRVVAQKVLASLYTPMLDLSNDNQPSITELLQEAVEAANAEVNKAIPDGGTTLTAVILMNNLAYIAHVGDSRLYLINGNNIDQITRDHSLVQRLIELDHITPEEAEDHPQKHVLYRVLGPNETVEVDMLTRRLPARSKLLLCSDGLWGLVENKDILEIVSQSIPPQDACQKLINLANKHGGLDNITVILIHLPD